MKIEKCPECEGKIQIRRISYVLLGVDIGKFPTIVCGDCKANFYEESVLDEIDQAAKNKGLWGLEHKTKINTIGNSLGVTLTKNQIDFSGISKGEEVLVYPESRSRFIIDIPKLRGQKS